MHRIPIAYRFADCFHGIGVDEKSYVLPNAILFVDHAETDAGKSLFQISQHVGD
jgi:hypothetical protein